MRICRIANDSTTRVKRSAGCSTRGAVPVVNENDTVSTEEITVGDNDQLSAMVTPLVGADLLILLTDVEGVLDQDGRVIDELAPGAAVVSRASKTARGTGGILSKVDAARKASLAGAHVVIASGRSESTLDDVLNGRAVGTYLAPNPQALKARKHWIMFTLKPRGAVVVDDGAETALRKQASLLPVGVVGVRGEFNAGDAVRLVTLAGVEIGRGLARLSAADAARVAGRDTQSLPPRFGGTDWVVVHRDDLAVLVVTPAIAGK